LLDDAEPFTTQIRDRRLALEVAAIHRLARTLVSILRRRDPLSDRVHLSKAGFLAISLLGVGEGLIRRAFSGRAGRPRKPSMREG
jgi:hypothetical protein